MTGSRARQAATIDAFSDFDIEIIAATPGDLVEDESWLSAFGDLWVCLRLGEGQDYPTRLAIYAEGKVDFSLCGPGRITTMVDDAALDPLYERGYEVLLDKQDLTSNLPKATGAGPMRGLPSCEQFTAAVEEFWFEAAHIPKYLLRDELWVVKFRDWTMKELLRRMIQWHALTVDDAVDLWHLGIGMKHWAASETWNDLGEVFARFDAADSWRGLHATIELFRRLALDVAEALGCAYPHGLDANISRHIDSLDPRGPAQP